MPELTKPISNFMRLESAGGILLLVSAVLALVVANSPLAGLYDGLLDLTVAIQIGALEVKKPLLLWINGGLMAVFFFLIGLELKREVLEGELSSVSQIVLPGLGALGGMLVPAAIYAWLTWGDAVALDGWAIPVFLESWATVAKRYQRRTLGGDSTSVQRSYSATGPQPLRL
jgi:NhaA family Na+:H+ antiporter